FRIARSIAEARQTKFASVQDIAKSIRKLANAKTGIPPSHWGHPEFENLAFLYDSAVNALILYAGGDKEGAERILDYFDQKLRFSYDQVRKSADTNRIYGILKIFDAIDPNRAGEKSVLALINAINVSSTRNRGEGQLEWYTTPGPTSFLIYAMSQINSGKYAESINNLKKVLLAMQAPDGGVRDGDRMPMQVHTEPHADAISALLTHTSNHVRAIVASLMSSQAIIDQTPWPKDAEDGWQWFNNHVFDAKNGIIHQGYGSAGLSTIFATDCYTWTMAGPFGDRIQKEYGLKALKKLSEILLHRGLVKITWTLPDGSTRTRMLFDFTDPTGQRVMGPVVDDPGHPDYGAARGGYHPLGSTEWTGGAVLAFQKNAVRFWNAGDKETARWFKALAIALEAEVQGSFYTINGVTISEYATGHNMAVGHGWRTPVAYVKDKKGKVLVQGGSPIGGFVALPATGINPFILRDNYKETYDKIPGIPIEKASKILEKELRHKPFTEKVLTEIPGSTPGIVEARAYNLKMWNAFVKANYNEAIKWSMKSINEKTWLEMAKRDNIKKQNEIGGLIFYPWGATFPNNEYYLHDAIWKYPLLNEIATAMWGLAASNFELGNKKEAKYWMKRIITEIPLHQIANVVYNPDTGEKDLVNGYWNALISWEHNPGRVARDYSMGTLYREILKEIGLRSAAPREVKIKKGDVAPRQTTQKTEEPKSTYVDRRDDGPIEKRAPAQKASERAESGKDDIQVMSYIRQLTDRNPNSARRSRAYREIVNRGEKAIPSLIANLGDLRAETNTRKWCALLLGEVGAPQYDKVKRVLESVISNEEGIYEWWHQTEAKNGLKILESAKERVEGRETQRTETTAGAVRESKAMPYISQLTDPDPGSTIRSRPYRAIIDMGAAAIPDLIATLKNPDANTDVRKWCARLLGEVGVSEYDKVKRVLQSVISNEEGIYEWWHQAEAQNGLQILESKKERKAPQQKQRTKATGNAAKEREAMSYINQLTVPDPGYTTHSRPYRAIINMGQSAQSALIKTLKNPSANTDVRKWCTRLLGEVGTLDTARSVLNEVINDRTGLYQWWHKEEARIGLKILLGRTHSYWTPTPFKALRIAL
ncbi:MAG: hypothetical protein KKH57_03080, partial [Candidatus Omnitrophica bacterium]|nr:hypothetical protein [Candidatus Omnitrophota bacterium]